MKSVEFCYWLQGMFELSKPQALNADQVELIRKHLAMVFYHEIDPSYPPAQQVELQDLHNSKPEKLRFSGYNRPVVKC